MIILMIAIAIYFFVGGMIFRDMFAELLPKTWPLIGAFLLSMLWVPFFMWIATNLFCETTERWYLKLAKTIFITSHQEELDQHGQ